MVARTKVVSGRNGSRVIELTAEENLACDVREAAWAAEAPARAAQLIQDKRRGAYQKEADHLHFEEARGEVSEGTWAAKVAEIKARFPKD